MKIILLLIISFHIRASELENSCAQRNGIIHEGFQCPKSRIYLPLKICRFRNSQGIQQFFDGCTGPTGKYKSIFFESCIKHDLCYHHEPASNGKTRKYCDQLMKNEMHASCIKMAKDIDSCKSAANRLYNAVRVVGLAAFHCENTIGSY